MLPKQLSNSSTCDHSSVRSAQWCSAFRSTWTDLLPSNRSRLRLFMARRPREVFGIGSSGLIIFRAMSVSAPSSSPLVCLSRDFTHLAPLLSFSFLITSEMSSSSRCSSSSGHASLSDSFAIGILSFAAIVLTCCGWSMQRGVSTFPAY